MPGLSTDPFRVDTCHLSSSSHNQGTLYITTYLIPLPAMGSATTTALRPLPTLPRSASGNSLNRLKVGIRSPPISPSGSMGPPPPPTPTLLIPSMGRVVDVGPPQSTAAEDEDDLESRKDMNMSPLTVESGSGMFGLGVGKGTGSTSSLHHHSKRPTDTIQEEIVDSNGMMMIHNSEIEKVDKQQDIMVEQVDSGESSDDRAGDEFKKQHHLKGDMRLSPPSTWNDRPTFSTLGRASSRSSLNDEDGVSTKTKVGSGSGFQRGNTSANGSVVSLIGGIEHTPTAWGVSYQMTR